jgi:hypothetical protein
MARKEDREGLVDLWVRCEMNPEDLDKDMKTLKWIDIGFEGNDPTSNFIGAGKLGLINLLHFFRNYETEALDCLRTSQTPGSEYLFARTGIDITCNLLRKVANFEIYSEFENASGREDVIYRFNRIFAVIFIKFNRFWLNSGKSDNITNFDTAMVR